MNKKPLKNKRFYLTIMDENGDEITLSFRSKRSLNKYIDETNYPILRIENKRPKIDSIYLSKREVESLEKLVATLNTKYDK
ncbi:MAG: hypothetical protein QJR05_13770 [Thermoanaerobacterium sp.]|nr:hypothetical protein [Thermoanaerobacterium sp.]